MSGIEPVPGLSLPDLDRTLGTADLVAYAGATWDWHRLHHDSAYLAERGLPTPVVDGQMLGALLAEQVQDAFGPTAFLRRLEFRFSAMVFAGETVRVTGKVTNVEPADGGPRRVTVAQRVTVTGPDGRPLRTAIAPATAEMELP